MVFRKILQCNNSCAQKKSVFKFRSENFLDYFILLKVALFSPVLDK